MVDYNRFCKCGLAWEDLPYHEDQVGCPVCDVPPEAEMKIYIFHCWDPDCDGMGNSLTCQKSNTPNMGYHCPECGKDLTLWKKINNIEVI